ncbi:hypothetical protein DH2020_014251 [Rehmannia glutinosa]|uniref:CCHC-type domain-containing protein n=1 Tax=Rehmannia glutinosa TaxID=99300 RepID=A0ABR0WXA4_REHGL
MSDKNLSIDELCGRMQLEEEEEGGLLLDNLDDSVQIQDLRWCLVGRFLSDRQVNFSSMKNMLASIWRPVKGVFIKDLGPNLFLFQFFHELDIARVQSNGPWTFDNLMLITKRLHVGEQPSKVLLFHVELWVQVYDLPFGFMTEKVGKSIGNYIGNYVEADQHSFSGVWQNYMRIRVAFDVRTPLKRRMKLKKSEEEWFWILFKYERLPTFCFYCGFLGHSDKFCAQLFNSSSVSKERAYGSWLRARHVSINRLGGRASLLPLQKTIQTVLKKVTVVTLTVMLMKIGVPLFGDLAVMEVELSTTWYYDSKGSSNN